VPTLPIEPLLPDIRATLAAGSRLVLVAPPGAGKTTRVPLSLLGQPWLTGQRLVMLEPRRLAARTAARRMAAQLGERVGQTVGYRVKGDTVVGRATRLEVVTEGVLIRMLQHDPFLEGIGGVLFDEFHERSLNADLGLALTLHAQRLVREDLRIVVMSATLDGAAVAERLGAPLLESAGRAFPVDTLHRARRDREWIEDGVARVVAEAVRDHEGDVLAFLPGAAEIRRTAARLGSVLSADVELHPLYGDLPPAAQDAALLPSAQGRRKVVLATNIAETSLTIEGVRIVVDSGLARAPRFSPRTGMSRLETVRISRASADQRRGRAGRTAPGVCFRLWEASDELQLAARDTPEILSADLSALALELAVAGIADPTELMWIDAPPAGALAQGRALLGELDALDADGAITAHGRIIADLGAHPRLAHLAVCARDVGEGALAADVLAVLESRDLLRAMPGTSGDADLRTRLEVLRGAAPPAGMQSDAEAVRRVRYEAAQWRSRLQVPEGPRDVHAVGELLAQAFPDRIARRRRDASGRYVLTNGTGAHFTAAQPLGEHEWLVVVETDGRVPEAAIYTAAPVTLDDLRRARGPHFITHDVVEWDERAERIVAVRRESLGAITVHEADLRTVDDAQVTAALLRWIARRGVGVLPWSEAAVHLRARLAFAHTHEAAWPAVDDVALCAALSQWLAPHLAGIRSVKQLQSVALTEALRSLLDWSQRAALDTAVPSHLEVPSGSRLRVDYTDPHMPSLAVRLQEVFGLAATPTVLGGRVPITLELLSPAHRPVQVTRDLAAFWRGSYAEVRKEMRGRYPKHDWPEDPAAAAPHRGRRPR
jgi:ATP-dependent helicase HrpB